MAKSKMYTAPKVSAKGKKWFVWFRYLDEPTGKMKLIIRKGGANYADLSDKERLSELNALRKAILFKLEHQGWNPINNSYPNRTAKQIELEKLKSMTFNKSLDFALSQCEVATKTKACYGTTVRFFQLAAEQLNISHVAIPTISRQHIKLILQHIKKERTWSNHAYNKHLGYIGAVIDRLIEWEVIEHNPAHKIKTLKVAETQKFIPYTDAEKKIIADYIYLNHYRYYIYLMIVYHTGIRPKEVLSLKIKDVDLNQNVITIYPDIEAENSKTTNIRTVPINQHLIPFLRELNLHEYPKNMYVFGSPFPSGRGNSGSSKLGRGAMHPDYFKPSLTQIKRDTVTKLWKKIVIDKLGINKYQYAMKHTGADDKILSGIPLDALKELYGHSSKYMTEKYARQVKEVYKKQIVENSPAFSV